MTGAYELQIMKARAVCLQWQTEKIKMFSVHGGKIELEFFGLFSSRRIPAKEGANIKHYSQWQVPLRTRAIHPQKRILFFIYNSRKETQFYCWVGLKNKKKVFLFRLLVSYVGQTLCFRNMVESSKPDFQKQSASFSAQTENPQIGQTISRVLHILSLIGTKSFQICL